VTSIENLKSLPPHYKQKYKEMTLDAAETVLGFLALIGLPPSILRREEKGGMKN
jgi:hypothetical protein